MKRSEINSAVRFAKNLLHTHHIALPFFGDLPPQDWKTSGMDLTRVKTAMLGWDVTDFGLDNFALVGAVLFTLRNGDAHNPHLGTPYAEKYIMLKSGQGLPMHYHKTKTEDIINRAGGDLMIEVYRSDENGLDLKTDVTVYQDGVKTVLPPGSVIHVQTGNSVTLTPYLYHRIFVRNGDTVIGEVSSVNDDNQDNFFLESIGRFAEIVEDEPAVHLLVNEYDKL